MPRGLRLRIGGCGSTLDEPRGRVPPGAGPLLGQRGPIVLRGRRAPRSPVQVVGRRQSGSGADKMSVLYFTYLLPACNLATLCLPTIVRLILPFYKPG